jgi:twinkle protein
MNIKHLYDPIHDSFEIGVTVPFSDVAFIPKANGVQLFGQHLWNSHGSQLIITEGEIDCMSVAQSLNYKWPMEHLEK